MGIPCLNTVTVESVKVSRLPFIKMNRNHWRLFTQWTKVLAIPKVYEYQISINFMDVTIPFCELVSNIFTVFCTWCAATASAMSLGWTELAPSVISSKHKVLPEENAKKTMEEFFNVVFEALEAGTFKKNTRFFLIPMCEFTNLQGIQKK